MEKLKSIIAASIAAITILGFSAFKVAEKFASPQSGWYEVDSPFSSPQDYDDPSNQTIGNHLPGGPSGPDCDPLNEEKPCAVYLEFGSSYTGPSSIENMTVADVISNPGAEISQSSAGNDDGYSRRSE